MLVALVRAKKGSKQTRAIHDDADAILADLHLVGVVTANLVRRMTLTFPGRSNGISAFSEMACANMIRLHTESLHL